jgi:hypothetical protein
MATYEFKVEIEGIDISNAILAPFTITNGRRTFNEGFARWSANLRSFKKETNAILAAANSDIEITGAGSKIEIQVNDPILSEWVTMFRGVVTSTSSDANTYSWSCIDEVFFALSNSRATTISGGFFTLDGYIGNIMAEAQIPYAADFEVGLTLTWPSYGPPATTRVDLSNWIQEVASLGAYQFLVLYPPDNRNVSGGKIYVMKLSVFDFATTSLSITNGAVDLNFSTNRDAGDILNEVNVTAKNPDDNSLRQNQTSINKVGIKRQEIDSFFDDVVFVGPGPYPVYPPAVEATRKLSESIIQQSSPFGYPLIDFRTSYDRVTLPVTKSPKEVFLRCFPGKVIDSSAVTEPTFQKKMVIQQVQHICSPDHWEIDILGANYRYASPPQTWAEVTSNLKWEDVPDYLTWDMIAVKDI